MTPDQSQNRIQWLWVFIPPEAPGSAHGSFPELPSHPEPVTPLHSVSRLTHTERHIIWQIFALKILQKAPTPQPWLRDQVQRLKIAEISLGATCNLK